MKGFAVLRVLLVLVVAAGVVITLWFFTEVEGWQRWLLFYVALILAALGGLMFRGLDDCTTYHEPPMWGRDE